MFGIPVQKKSSENRCIAASIKSNLDLKMEVDSKCLAQMTDFQTVRIN